MFDATFNFHPRGHGLALDFTAVWDYDPQIWGLDILIYLGFSARLKNWPFPGKHRNDPPMFRATWEPLRLWLSRSLQHGPGWNLLGLGTTWWWPWSLELERWTKTVGQGNRITTKRNTTHNNHSIQMYSDVFRSYEFGPQSGRNRLMPSQGNDTPCRPGARTLCVTDRRTFEPQEGLHQGLNLQLQMPGTTERFTVLEKGWEPSSWWHNFQPSNRGDDLMVMQTNPGRWHFYHNLTVLYIYMYYIYIYVYIYIYIAVYPCILPHRKFLTKPLTFTPVACIPVWGEWAMGLAKWLACRDFVAPHLQVLEINGTCRV